jgi:hypothetical protein
MQTPLVRAVAPQDLIDGIDTSPRMGVHFDWSGETLRITYPDGRPF